MSDPTRRSLLLAGLLSCALGVPASAQTVLAYLPGGPAQSSGDSVTGIGDINYNGLSEIVQGSPTAPLGGRIMVFADDGTIIREMWWFGGPAEIEEMGRAVDGGDPLSGSGDVNNDGFPDIAVGAPGSHVVNGLESGCAIVFNGKGGSLPLLAFYGAAAHERFGSDVAMVGLVDGDACSDVMVSAPMASPPYVNVYSGATGALIHHFVGGYNEEFGSVVSGVGDLDGDGRNELLVGAPKYDDNHNDSGVARLYSGRTGQLLLEFHGTANAQRFGMSVAAAGDVDADGIPDLVIGGDGVARVFSGADGSLIYALTGNEGFGQAVTGVGDQNGDGYADLLIGAPYDDTFIHDAGAATLVSGRDTSVLYFYTAHLRNELLGEEVAIANDTDGDGSIDFLIGAIGQQKSLLCSYHHRLKLAPPSPGLAGTTNSVLVTGATPDWDVTLEYAYLPDFRQLVNSDGLHLDIAPYPFAPLKRQVGPSGTVLFAGRVSPAMSGKTVLVQAYMQPHVHTGEDEYHDISSVSDVMQYTFP